MCINCKPLDNITATFCKGYICEDLKMRLSTWSAFHCVVINPRDHCNNLIHKIIVHCSVKEFIYLWRSIYTYNNGIHLYYFLKCNWEQNPRNEKYWVFPRYTRKKGETRVACPMHEAHKKTPHTMQMGQDMLIGFNVEVWGSMSC